MSSKHNLELYKLKAEISKAFSDPKRLIIITELRDGEKSVGELAEGSEIHQAVISRQLAILRSSNVVIPRRAGNNVFYRLSDKRICEACDIVHAVLLDHLVKNRELAENLLG
jgi:ArsR family transcriptional regulator, virulence genes transcriptional regulator